MSEKFLLRNSLCLLTIFFLASVHLAEAQQPGNVHQIGYLSGRGKPGPSNPDSSVDALRQGLRDLGYVEGKNLAIEYRYAEGTMERLPKLATELVRLKVDVIVSLGNQPSQAAKQATATIPIVFPGVGDPVAWGLVESLARPGGNITGLTNYSPKLSGKRVELLKETLPRITRVAVLRDPRQPPESFEETLLAAQLLGLKVQFFEIRDATDVESAFSAMSRDRAEALIALPQTVLIFHRSQILELATKSRLPATYGDKVWVEAGGLMSYGPDTIEINRRAAVYVDKILQGSKPADLPVEQPTDFEFVINLKTAKQIGLTIPPNVLARADRVIK